MSDIKIIPAERITGMAQMPGDKSISHRAVMIGSIARGLTRIKNFLTSQDCLHTLKAFQSLGVDIKPSGSTVLINGLGPASLKPSSKEIYLGNSGTSMRLLAGILAAQPFQSVLTGDDSLSQRPMDRIIKPLRMMGAEINGRNEKFPPLTIKGGRLRPVEYESPVASAQVKSAVILAGCYADGVTSVAEPAKSRDHTERMLEYFGGRISVDGLKVSIKGPARLESRSLEVPCDISGAAFFMTLAAILKNSKVTLSGVLYNPTRLGFIDVLLQMGAHIQIKNIRQSGPEEICDITAGSGKLRAIRIDPKSVPRLIDELPVLMVTASFADGRTEIHGARELRIKETDRINSIVGNLRKMGAEISVDGDDITIVGRGLLRSAELDSFGDHRTAMSMAVAGLAAKGESLIRGVDCVDTSFPGFFEVLDGVLER